MAAYVIFSREKPLDSRELSIYSDEVSATLAGHNVKPLVLYGSHQDLEGAASEGIVVLEFLTADADIAGYDGPAYHKVREHRFKSGEFRVALVEWVA